MFTACILPMTTALTPNAVPRSADPIKSEVDYETLAEKFRPIFADIAQGVVERERDHVLPFQQIDALKNAASAPFGCRQHTVDRVRASRN